MLKRLVLFDIDGTLLSTGGAGRAALRAAMEQVYGTAGPVDTYDMGGRTIQEIVLDLLRDTGLGRPDILSRFSTFSARWAVELRQRVGRYDVRPCPGAPELVASLAARPDLLIGILTANTATTAAIKLQAGGYDQVLFHVGSYGDISEVRADLVPVAVDRAEQLTGRRFVGHEVVLVGDSPLDVACAHQVGARSIAVTTGGWSRAELQAARADFVFDDLTDVQAVLAAILAPLSGERPDLG